MTPGLPLPITNSGGGAKQKAGGGPSHVSIQGRVRQPCRLNEVMKLWKLANMVHVSRLAVCRKQNFYNLVGLYQGSLEIVKSCDEML